VTPEEIITEQRVLSNRTATLETNVTLAVDEPDELATALNDVLPQPLVDTAIKPKIKYGSFT